MRSNLSRKILLPVLITIAIGLISALLVTYLNARVVVQEELTKRLQREVQLSAKLIDNWLQARSNDIAIWSRQEVFSEALTEGGYYGKSARDGAKNLVATLRKGYPFYEGIFLANLQGEVIAFSTMDEQPTTRLNLAERPYFQETLQGKNVISPIIASKLTGKKIFIVATPVIVAGEVVGVLGGVLDFAAFKSLFIDDYKIKQHGYAFLVDNRQILVLGSSSDNEQDLSDQKHNNYLQRITTGNQGIITHRMDSSETLTVSHHLKQVDWSFAINQSLDSTLRPLLQIEQIGLAVGLAVFILISFVIGALFRRLVSVRLQGMLHVIAKVKEGDLSHRIPEPPRISDEIEVLIGSFNAMIEQLDATLHQLNAEIQVRKTTEKNLADHQENLEAIIAKRSRELEVEINERQRIEARLGQAEKMEMIGTLAGGVAHDLNNILSGVVTYPDLLLLKIPPDSPLTKPLLAIKRSGEKAAAIVQDLLTLARRGVTSKEAVNCNLVIDEYLHSPECKQLQDRCPGVEIVAEYAEDLQNILGSPVHLAKTVMNLVSNGAESMTQGGQLRIKTVNRYVDNPLNLYEHIDEGEYVVLIVEDQGSGIPPEDLDKIFEPFYTTKTMGKSGTGLGMAVVWGTVKDHGGFINCESALGQGTKFTLFFPVTSRIRLQQREVIPLGEYRGHGEKILVIDDSEEQREIASAILKNMGYQVATVDSGEAGVERLKQESFDLLLLDMILGPGIDGLDTYRKILAHTPGQKAIIASGFSETERVSEALRLGARQYLKKPYTIAKLGMAVRHGLGAGYPPHHSEQDLSELIPSKFKI